MWSGEALEPLLESRATVTVEQPVHRPQVTELVLGVVPRGDGFGEEAPGLSAFFGQGGEAGSGVVGLIGDSLAEPVTLGS